MLGLLRIEGPATATSLAARLGLNTGATSYHLRHLAQHGFIVDDAERGNARDRWWRAAHQSTTTGPEDPGDDEAGEVLDAYLQAVAVVYTEQLQRAMEDRALLPEPWRNASEFSDYVLRLTPAKARGCATRSTRRSAPPRRTRSPRSPSSSSCSSAPSPCPAP